MKCIECGKIGPDTNWKYCSRACKCKGIAKLPRGDHKQTYMICLECGGKYCVVNSRVKKTKFCSKSCLMKNTRKKK
jgi:hypothetical protein